jgi:cytochrome c-type biogenesis protein CcsB
VSTALHWAALACYLAGTVVYLSFVLWQRQRLHAWGQAVLWAGLGLHTLALAAAWMESGTVPAVSLRQFLDVFSWGIMAAALFINLRLRVMILGALTAPLCSLLLLGAWVLPSPADPPSALMASIWVVIHVVAMLIGYGLLALTFLGGILYLIQENLIRAKRLGAAFKRLPSLSRVDELCQRALVAGFTAFTLGMISGAIYGQVALGSYWRWDPKEVWSLITWLFYAALLHTRLTRGWRGRRGAWLAVIAFGVLMFTFIGAGLLFPGYHNFATITSLTGPPQ